MCLIASWSSPISIEVNIDYSLYYVQKTIRTQNKCSDPYNSIGRILDIGSSPIKGTNPVPITFNNQKYG